MGAEELVHALDATPLRHQHEQRLAVRTTEHAREAEVVQLDPLEDFAALDDARRERARL